MYYMYIYVLYVHILYVYICIYMYIHVYICLYVHTHTHTHTHTYVLFCTQKIQQDTDFSFSTIKSSKFQFSLAPPAGTKLTFEIFLFFFVAGGADNTFAFEGTRYHHICCRVQRERERERETFTYEGPRYQHICCVYRVHTQTHTNTHTR